MVERRWSGRTGDLVDGWWWTPVTGQGIVVPDGAVDLVWSSEHGVVLAGPDIEPRPVGLVKAPVVVGLRLRTGVARAILGAGLDEIVGRQVPIDAVASRHQLDVLNEDLDRFAPAVDRTVDQSAGHDLESLADLLARAVSQLVPSTWEPDPAVESLVLAFQRDGGTARATAPGSVEVGSRQLRRRFTAAVGYGPALYRRIARLDRFTDLADRHPDWSLATLSATAGYSDQPHLNRDCRDLLGLTPAALRSTW